MTTNTIKTQLVQLILKNAKTPSGFSTMDTDRPEYAHMLARKMVEDGVLEKVCTGVRHFSYVIGPKSVDDIEKWAAYIRDKNEATLVAPVLPPILKVKRITSMPPLQPYRPKAWGATRPGSDLSHIGSLHAGRKIPHTPAKSQGTYANKTRITDVLKARS